MDETATEQIDQLNRTVVQMYEQGRFADAAALAAKACELARESVGEHDPRYAASLNNLAVLYKSMGHYGDAEPLCRRAAEIRRATLGEEHPDYAGSLNNLAGLFADMGRYVEAEPLYLQAREIWRSAWGEHDSVLASVLNNLALLYLDVGRHDESESCLLEARDIVLRAVGIDHPLFRTNLVNLASVYFHQGRYAQAEPLYQQALELDRKERRDRHPDFAASLDGLALLYRVIGRMAEAEPLLLQAHDIRKVCLGEAHPEFALSLNNLARLYETTGRFEEAEQLHLRARAIRRAILGEKHPDFASTLNNLASLYIEMGRYAEAEPLLRQAREIRRETLGEGHPDHEASLNNLAALLDSIGSFAEAELLYRQALEIRGRTFAKDDPNHARGHSNLALILARTGRASEALTFMLDAMSADDGLIAQACSIGSESQHIAYLEALMGPYHALLSLVVRYLADSAVAARGAMDVALRRKAIAAESLAAQRDAVLSGRYPHLLPRLEALDLLRRQIIVSSLAGPVHEGPREFEQKLAQWIAEKERLEAELARQIPEINLEQRLRAASRDAVALHLPANAKLVEFVRFNVFDFHAIPAHGEPSWKPARYVAFVLPAGLPDDVQMVDLGEAEPIDRMIAAFREQIVRGGGRERSFTQASSRAQQRDFQPDAGQTERVLVPAPGRDLHAVLIDPLLPTLQGARRLILSPDGDLTRLPFEVLPADDGTYLTDTYRVSYLASGRDVLRTHAELTRQPGPALVAADPDFDLGGDATARETDFTPLDQPLAGRHSRDLNRASLRFSRLPGTGLEGERIAKLLGTEPWLEGEALEARLRARRSPEILHLATHGFFLEDQKIDPNDERGAFGMLSFGMADERGRRLGRGIENPLLRSGLALAGVNTWLAHGNPPEEAEDGLLTAEDVTGLDLLDTELVVLSACETGLGEVRVGEGVFGLRRAFVLAGAKTLVMSLWKVPDLATAILMVRFYENLLGKAMERDEALREAQRYLRHTTVGEIRQEWLRADVITKLSAGRDRTHRELEELAAQPDDHRPFEHPFYWGAFICQGETRPLRAASTADRPADQE